MEEETRKKNNDTKLLELHPTFRDRITRVIANLESQGIRLRIYEAWRSREEQLKKFNSGVSHVKFGFHNITAADGKPDALAVDLIDDDSPVKSSISYLLHLAAAAEAEGLITGIRWGLPKVLSGGIDVAIATQDWNAKIKTGWDTNHVEPAGITIAQAKSGMRPS
jgi:hypothetical protein